MRTRTSLTTMGPRLRKRIVILSGSLLFTIFSFQLTGFSVLRGDEESQKFTNDALPSSGKVKFRTFPPFSLREKNRAKSLEVGRRLKEESGQESKDTRRTLQDIRTADDIKGHPRSLGSPVVSQGDESSKNVTVAMTTRLEFERVFPSLLEEERCPLCYGTTNCDQIYVGNVSFNVGHVNLSEPHAILAHWGGRKILGKRLVKQELFQRLERIVCEEANVDSTKPCEVNGAAAKSWLSKSTALSHVYKLHQDVYEDRILSLSATTCASQDFLDKLKELYGVTRWRRGVESTEMAILAATLALDPEPALLKFFRYIPPLQSYFPEYLGECGRVILTERSGTPLVKFLQTSWEERVDLSIKVLQMIEDFHESSDKWLVLVLDFGYENFEVTPSGQLMMVNLGNIVVVDKEQAQITSDTQLPLANRTDPCNEDCMNTFVKHLQTDPHAYCPQVPSHVQFMYMMACHSLLSDLIMTKYERFFQPPESPRKPHPGGLLRDAPYEVDAKLSELLYECVFEGAPGKRMHSVKILKHLLHIIKRGFSYQKSAKTAERSL